ncbi:uncharacterized protein MYCFIDRAFT_212422, partial [Pseudocercospora fijiensis CIRAD86]
VRSTAREYESSSASSASRLSRYHRTLSPQIVVPEIFKQSSHLKCPPFAGDRKGAQQQSLLHQIFCARHRLGISWIKIESRGLNSGSCFHSSSWLC